MASEASLQVNNALQEHCYLSGYSSILNFYKKNGEDKLKDLFEDIGQLALESFLIKVTRKLAKL